MTKPLIIGTTVKLLLLQHLLSNLVLRSLQRTSDALLYFVASKIMSNFSFNFFGSSKGLKTHHLT
jgi:hypothetical protein